MNKRKPRRCLINLPHMIKLSALGLGLMAVSAPSFAFLEEGGAQPNNNPAFGRCTDTGKNANAAPLFGDFALAAQAGCNPFDDNDSAFSYQSKGDMLKSSMHFNMTQAAALAAGYQPCAAFAVALADEGADVGSAGDRLFWAPLPPGIDPQSCADLFAAEGITPVSSAVDNRPGASISPDFTQRAVGTRPPEINREAATFHWNPTFETADLAKGTFTTHCTAPDPIPNIATPYTDLVAMKDLWQWAALPGGENLLNQCNYAIGSGPLIKYSSTNPIKPNSLSALGAVLHSVQDAHSHKTILDSYQASGESAFIHPLLIPSPAKSDRPMDLRSLAGFVTSHYAGEYGVLKNGALGGGKIPQDVITVVTETGFPGYHVTLHSEDSFKAAETSYAVLLQFLRENGHSQYQALEKPACSGEVLKSLFKDFAGTPNKSIDTAAGKPSGAKVRSDMADKLSENLIQRKGCAYK